MSIKTIKLEQEILMSFFIYFVIGFIAASVSYLYTNLISNKDKDITGWRHVFKQVYGAALSGVIGGLLAMAIDRSIFIAVMVGLMQHVIYMTMIRASKGKQFFTVVREFLLKVLQMP